MPNGIHLEVYTLADPSQASEVVDSVLQLVDDHNPKPVMNGKPFEKNPTAVDKFDQQQSEYESRGKNKDRMKQVHDHNSGYPQLRDELEKRRSFTRVRLFEIPSDNRENTNTRTANRSRQIKNPRRKERKPKRRHYRSRVTKYKKKENKTKLRKALQYTRPRSCVCDYCGCQYVDMGCLRRCASHPVSTTSIERCKSHHTRDTMSNMSHRYPEPSEASVSSYHTFYSWDNEPME